MTGELRKFYCYLHCSQNNIRVIKKGENEMGGTCGTYGRQEIRISSFCG